MQSIEIGEPETFASSVPLENSLMSVVRLSKSYGRIRALENVSFSIRLGEILGLIGPNGAGKTTLFECVAGLEPADEGAVLFGSSAVGGRTHGRTDQLRRNIQILPCQRRAVHTWR